MSLPETKRRRSSHPLVAVAASVVVLALMIVVNLPYQYVHRDGYWVGEQTDSMYAINADQEVSQSMAGWPLRFLIRYEKEGDPELRYWSPVRLVSNAAIAISVSIALFFFVRFRNRKIMGSSRPARTKSRFDLAFAVAILALPIAVWGWYQWHWVQDQRLARQIRRSGSCFVSSRLPAVIATQLPTGIARSMERLRLIDVSRPSDKLLQRVAALPELDSLRIR
ncbi:MAG: hypothetical protein AAGA03_15105, partial [Planctomycetota bacterium]